MLQYIRDYDQLPVCWDYNTDKHHGKHLPNKTIGIAALSWEIRKTQNLPNKYYI